MNPPEGMIPAEEFAKQKGIAVEKVIKMIKDGFYSGRVIDDQWYANANESNSGSSIKTINNSGSSKSDTPLLIVLFFVLAGLSLLGGLTLCSQLWPGDPGYGNEWKTFAYIPSFTWLTVGIVQFALFTAIGQGLLYLKQIVINTKGSKA